MNIGNPWTMHAPKSTVENHWKSHPCSEESRKKGGTCFNTFREHPCTVEGGPRSSERSNLLHFKVITQSAEGGRNDERERAEETFRGTFCQSAAPPRDALLSNLSKGIHSRSEERGEMNEQSSKMQNFDPKIFIA